MRKQRRVQEVQPLRRRGDAIFVIDQLLLPRKTVYRRCATPRETAAAIRDMVLRGAPLIGCAAAYGYAFGARGVKTASPAVLRKLDRDGALLLASRPTAVNLAWAVARMAGKARELHRAGSGRFYAELLVEADRIAEEDVSANRRMAELGARLLRPGSVVMTLCNAGALATTGIGTALGVVRRAYRLGRVKHVYPCETRPYLQGSRLTLWELMREGIPATLITDSMAAHIMKTERIDAVFVGADRIAADADVANKIGTYGLAILARAHGVSFYVVAPSSTVDLSLRCGGDIPIEERSSREVLWVGKHPIAPRGARARHPAFDVTPHRLVTAIVTERGVVRPVNGAVLRRVLGKAR
ncbi:MAG: S-methyl-5-thioribose-1-phosphate isomerase [Elusimicrobia bacterium GWA2_69_24]|nr:MAG: S-methyl-5-thioribose-1-phosphate isomerase [Elusimicrobia bacterium GWA2_69_24]HBL18663.1 S-methyl-5-thioribose-1-phosphate isomerase [Elusimicrobiota bacterium]